MKTKKRILRALVLSLFAAAGTVEAQGAQFSNVYVFGDSLSDAGYYRPFLASLGIPAAIVEQLGRFTTNPGPVWSEVIAQYYGVTPGPSNTGGTIYAQGGARVAEPSASTPPGSAQRPVSTQIGEFLAANGSAADPDALYAVWVGGNDFLQNIALFQAGAITQAQLQANVLGAATAEIGQVARLMQAGARFVMVVSLPDIGIAPASIAGGPAAVAAATQLSAGYNTTLFSGLAAQGLRVIPVDLFTFLNEIRANPALYGFTNVTGVACGPSPLTGSSSAQFCLGTNLVAASADQTYLFADTIHPTTAGHRIISQFALSFIEGPFNYSLLAEVPLRTRAMHVMGVNEGLVAANSAEPGKLTAFASAGGGRFEVDPATGVSGLDSSNRHVTVGFTMRASEGVTLGVAAGKSLTSASFGQSMGGFRTDELAFSIFASARWGGLYASGVASIADIDFTSIHRNIQLGAATRRPNARTDGSNASASILAGYDFRLGRFAIGPTVGVTTQNVDVNGFSESGGESSNLRIFEQKRRSEVWSAGVRASCEIAGWTPWVRVTADKERRDEERLVSASPLSIASGNEYDIPAYRSDSKFTTVALGARGWVNERLAVGISAYRVTGRSGIDEEGASVQLSLKF